MEFTESLTFKNPLLFKRGINPVLIRYLYPWCNASGVLSV